MTKIAVEDYAQHLFTSQLVAQKCVSDCLHDGEFGSGWLVTATTIAEPVETWYFCSMLLKTEERLED